jgi:hypothetical protein
MNTLVQFLASSTCTCFEPYVLIIRNTVCMCSFVWCVVLCGAVLCGALFCVVLFCVVCCFVVHAEITIKGFIRFFVLGWLCIMKYTYHNQLNALFIFSLLIDRTSTCFRHINRPSSEGRMYICGKWYSWLSAGLARPADSQLFHLPQIYIHSASWWWATDIPKTCRGVITQ